MGIPDDMLAPMADNSRKPRVLVFIVAYNAEKTIREVVLRIPVELLNTYDSRHPDYRRLLGRLHF